MALACSTSRNKLRLGLLGPTEAWQRASEEWNTHTSRDFVRRDLKLVESFSTITNTCKRLNDEDERTIQYVEYVELGKFKLAW